MLLNTCKQVPEPEPVTKQPISTELKLVGDFGWKLFQHQILSKPLTQNVLISPLCMEMVFHLAANGAAGGTYDEMASALEISDLRSRNQVFKSLMSQVGKHGDTEFGLSNGLMYDPLRVSIKDEYKDLLKNYYDADNLELSFSEKTSVNSINQWVKDKTENRIDKIIEEISEEEAAFLISCLYFKSDWKNPFDPTMTAERLFKGADGTSKEVPFMYADAAFNAFQDKNWIYTEIPYANDSFYLAMVMPTSEEQTDPQKWITSLSSSKLHELSQNAASMRLMLRFPKFELRYEAEMSESVKAAGIKQAFKNGQADFSKMSEEGKRMFITRVMHKTFLLVDEKGSEGAAVGSIGIGVTSIPPSHIYNRPFIAVLMDKNSGRILFAAALSSF